MAFKLADRILETTTSTGTSAISLSNVTPSGYNTFQSGVGHGVGTYYAIVHQTVNSWEVGYGVVTTGDPGFPASGDAPVLTRTTVIQSSLVGNGKVNFSAGTKDVFVVYPAAKALFLDPDNNVGIGSGLDGVSPDLKYRLYVEGDVRASGIHAGSGIFIDQGSAPTPTTNQLYNVGGTLYWGDNVLSATSSTLFNITAGSGEGELPIGAGSGLHIVGGENVVTSISDNDGGSGVITISVPNIESSRIFLSASTVPSGNAPSGTPYLTLGVSSGIFIKGGTNVTATLSDGGDGSGIITLDANNYTAGTGLVLSGPSGIDFNALPATDDTAGIVKLSQDVTSDSGVAITPYGVQQALIASGVFTSFLVGANNVDQSKDSGIGPITLATGSGILIRGGDNITASMSNSDGSGIVSLSSVAYTAGSGLRLIPDAGAGAQFNIDVSGLANLGAGDTGPDNSDKLIIYDVSADGLRAISVSGLAASPSLSGVQKFKTVSIRGDTGYTWGGADVVADSATDTLEIVAGTGIRLDTDSSNDAVRISTSGLGFGASDGIAPISLNLGSGLFIQGGTNVSATLSQSNGSGLVTIDSSVGSMNNFNAGILGDSTTIENGSGIMFLAGDNVAISHRRSDGSGLFTISSTGVGTRLMLGGSDGRENMQLSDGSGLFFVGGDNVTVTLSNADEGSGVVTIATTGVGTRLMLDASDGRGAIQLGESSGIRIAGGDGILATLSTNPYQGSGIITIDHDDTSSQASVDNAGNVFIQDITLDGFGHVTALTSATSSAAGGGGQAASGADGQVQYNDGGFFAGASGLYYDDTNNRVGIGTTSPTTQLHIVGTGLASEPLDDSSNPTGRPELPDSAGSYLDPVLLLESTYHGAGSDKLRGGWIAPSTAGGLTINTLNSSDSINIGTSGTTLIHGNGDTEKVGILTDTPNSTLSVSGSMSVAVSGWKVVSKGNSDVNKHDLYLNDKNCVILYDAKDMGEPEGQPHPPWIEREAASGVIHLPAAGPDVFGRMYTVKKVDSSPSGVRIVSDGGKIDRYKDEERLWIKDDALTFICGTGIDGGGGTGYNWYTISRSITPHSACLRKQTGSQAVKRNTHTKVNMDHVMFSHPSGMAEIGPRNDGPGQGTNEPFSDMYFAGITASGGMESSGVRILRDGWYRCETTLAMGTDFDHNDTLGHGTYVLNGHEDDPLVKLSLVGYSETPSRGTVHNTYIYSNPSAGCSYFRAGDFVFMAIVQRGGGTMYTPTSRGRTPTLLVQEILVPDPSGQGMTGPDPYPYGYGTSSF